MSEINRAQSLSSTNWCVLDNSEISSSRRIWLHSACVDHSSRTVRLAVFASRKISKHPLQLQSRNYGRGSDSHLHSDAKAASDWTVARSDHAGSGSSEKCMAGKGRFIQVPGVNLQVTLQPRNINAIKKNHVINHSNARDHSTSQRLLGQLSSGPKTSFHPSWGAGLVRCPSRGKG